MSMRAVVGFVFMTMSALASAQTAPPIHGVTGTIATDTSIRDEHRVARGVARGAAKLASLGRQRGADNPLDVLIEGRHVLVRDGAASIEGVVIDVNRSRRQITVRFPDRHTETLRVLDRAAGAQDGHVVVTLADQPNATTYDFRRVS
jgi:hypothetical protein